MEIIGKIALVGINRGGRSETTGNEWASKTIVIDTMDSNPKKLAFNASGVNRVQDICDMELKTGEMVLVRFEPRSREYNEQWYSELSLVNITRVGVQTSLSLDQGETPQEK